jgi:uncharacterized alpha-E superfamily protein
MLLSRVADNVYWGARYLERAEDTARVVRAYTELIVDLPVTVASSWEPLLAIAGSRAMFDITHPRADEAAIVSFLAAERANPGSVASSIDQARENLRTTREVLPREAWQAVNDLYLFSHANANGAVERRSRARFLGRVIHDSQQIEGVITSAMSRDAAFHLWSLGRALERADMTTRVVGVRAAGLLAAARGGSTDEVHDDVQWMGMLRSVSGLQMYQRAVRGPVEGTSVVRFLLLDQVFPRSVASCVQAARHALEHLPHRDRTLASVDRLEALLASMPDAGDDGAALDAATDAIQVGLATVSDSMTAAFLRSVR